MACLDFARRRQSPSPALREKVARRRRKRSARSAVSAGSAASGERGLRPPSADAPFACSTIAAKAAGSVMARSDSTLRSTSIPAAARPEINRL